VQGGKAGQPGCVTVYKAAGGSEVISKVRNYPVKPGDVVVLETGGGGGWGPPSERAREVIKRDVARGYVSREAAERDYGVKL
jgi:N-methylhydantoinase B